MCTGIRFTSADGAMYFGRNLDWSTPFGEHIVVTPKGYALRQAFPKGADAEPSKHALIGMGITYQGYPLYFDCGNDSGLAVAGLNFPGYAQYEEKAVPGKTNVAAYEFPVWVAANFETVDEVEAALADVAIVAKPVSSELGVSLLHWIIGDATRSIVVEYLPDGMHVHRNPVDTLANQPTFDWHMENLRTYLNVTSAFPGTVNWGNAEFSPFGAGAGSRGIPGDSYTTSRFVKAAFLNANYPAKETEQDNVMRLFHTLGNVAMVEGSAQMGDGTWERTIYTGCFSAKTGTYYYNTDSNPALRSACLNDYRSADPHALIEPAEKLTQL